MSKNKKMVQVNRDYTIEALREALDRNEGVYSNIPVCCIESYLDGRTYAGFKNILNPKEQKKLEKWEYVPCDVCFKKEKINKLKHNGMSDVGRMISAIISILKEKGEQ